MEKNTSTKLFDEIRTKLARVNEGPRLIAGLSLLLEDYHHIQDSLADAELKRAMAQFDRDCLLQEKIELEEALAAEDTAWKMTTKSLSNGSLRKVSHDTKR